ncbi:M24 family metallopeptidase [Actinoalloteichus spitiensis]|uniref:M24 family metallopeptidase n=1 Tax=Actinoalloteichus spitiensis TaxID=252394 RepID=UPI000367C9F0|nr:Xaa-Pro peptidase family protein [Actinoalloteichus spitiensis]
MVSPSSSSLTEPQLFRDRLSRVAEAARHADVDALLVAPGSDLRYLLGIDSGSFERLTALVVPSAPGQRPALVTPKLEEPGFASLDTTALGLDLVTWIDGESPYDLVVELVNRAGAPARLAVGDSMTAQHVLGLRASAPDAEQVLAGAVIRQIRMRKSPEEIEALAEAGAAIDRVHARMAEWLRPGRSEAEVGADIAAAIVAEGHTAAEFVIVGSGPNGASPHHELSDRVIQPGDVVVVDIGGPTPAGYNSDCTRTYAVGEPADADVREVYAVLERAQRAAVDAVRPGVTAESVDAAAREVITAAGYGEFFVHRTGHGIGLDVHEEPYIVGGNGDVLEPGTTFSVEPGIYFPGRWGARIEDIVAVTGTGVRRLNTRPRALTVLPT